MKQITIILVFFTVLLGQESEKAENACQSDLIKQARREGMRSIGYKELPQYFMDVWKCRKEKNGKKTLQRINQRTIEVDHENSAKFQGFTSTCAYCASSSVLIFYIFKLSGN